MMEYFLTSDHYGTIQFVVPQVGAFQTKQASSLTLPTNVRTNTRTQNGSDVLQGTRGLARNATANSEPRLHVNLDTVDPSIHDSDFSEALSPKTKLMQGD